MKKEKVNMKLLKKSIYEIKENELIKYIENNNLFFNELIKIFNNKKNIEILENELNINDYEIFLIKYFLNTINYINKETNIYKNFINLYELLEIEKKENEIYYIINDYYFNIKNIEKLNYIIKEIIISILNINYNITNENKNFFIKYTYI